jgi:hypothetical protein
MAKTFLLIRFDNFPKQEVSTLLLKFREENDVPQFITTPTTLFTFFKSKFSHKDIYIELAQITPPLAFFLIDVTDNDFAINLPESVSMELIKYLGKNKINKGEYQSLEDKSLDELKPMLAEAIESENYELCSKIQAIINEKTK